MNQIQPANTCSILNKINKFHAAKPLVNKIIIKFHWIDFVHGNINSNCTLN